MGRRIVMTATSGFVALASLGLAVPANAANGVDKPSAGEPRVVGIEHRDLGIEHRALSIVRRVESISGDIKTEESPKSVEVTLAADVLFEFDQAALGPAAAQRINETAEQVKSASGPVAIVGYTDSVGTDAYNADLSLRRANSVRDALAVAVPGAAFTVEGKGAADPVAPNATDDGSDNPAGRALNRRVTITIPRSG